MLEIRHSGNDGLSPAVSHGSCHCLAASINRYFITGGCGSDNNKKYRTLTFTFGKQEKKISASFKNSEVSLDCVCCGLS